MLTRCCVVCKSRKQKSELIRVVGIADGTAIVDQKQKINTRGSYFCNHRDCIIKAKKMLAKNKLNIKIKVKNEALYSLLEKLEQELGE